MSTTTPVGSTSVRTRGKKNENLGQNDTFTYSEEDFDIVKTTGGCDISLKKRSETCAVPLIRESYYVNAITGDNSGKDRGTLLKPWKTLEKFNEETCGRLLSSPTGTVTLFIQSDIPANDPLTFEFALAKANSFYVKGAVTVVQSGTITGSVDVNPAANLAGTVTDTGVATWTPFLNHRIVLTDPGFIPGATAWIAKATAANTARVSYWGLSVSPDGFYVPVPGPPFPGITYDIQKLSEISWGSCIIHGGPVPVFTGVSVAVIDLQIRGESSSIDIQGTGVHLVQTSGCRYKGRHYSSGNARYNSGFAMSCFDQGMLVTTGTLLLLSTFLYQGGGFAECQVLEGANCSFGLGNLFQKTDLNVGGTSSFEDPVGFFDCNFGVVIGRAEADTGGKMSSLSSGFFGATGWVPCFGSNNALPFRLAPGSSFAISQIGAVALPTIQNNASPAGPGNLAVNFCISDDVPTDASSWDKATATYTLPRPFTWAGLVVNAAAPTGFQTQGLPPGGSRVGSNAVNAGFGTQVTYSGLGV